MNKELDLEQLRHKSWRRVQALKLKTNPGLPLFDSTSLARTLPEVLDRMMCLFAVAQCAWGAPTDLFLEWLDRQRLTENLSKQERAYLRGGEGGTDFFRHQVQGIWALAWAVQVIPKLTLEQCSDSFAKLLPSAREDGSLSAFKQKCRFRTDAEIVGECDFYYCAHWAMVDAALAKKPTPIEISVADVAERRRALEWLVGEEEWYAINLDT